MQSRVIIVVDLYFGEPQLLISQLQLCPFLLAIKYICQILFNNMACNLFSYPMVFFLPFNVYGS